MICAKAEMWPTLVGMAEPGGLAGHEARMKHAQRRSLELQHERLRLHDRVLETAELVRRSHEQTAQTLEKLADTGPAEHAARRRRAAEQSRRLAEEEGREIVRLRGRRSGDGTEGVDPGGRQGPDSS
jgi:hypothetical protein